MAKYKVVCKIEVRGEDAADRENMCRQLGTETEFVAYKIIAGFYIFYITQEVYEQGIQAGWIQPMVEEMPVFFFDTLLRIRGKVCYHRMKTALKLSTPEYLRECLERIGRSPEKVRIRIHRVQWHGEKPVLTPLSEVFLNMAAGIVLEKQSFHKNAAFDPLFHVESYEGLLDVLADLSDREYMNSRDLYEQFAGNDFYDADKVWCERRYKLDFEWIEEEHNAVT